MKKLIPFILGLILLLSIAFAGYNTFVVVQFTPDKIYVINYSGNVDINCSVDSSGTVITNLTLWSDYSGLWEFNASNSSTVTAAGVIFQIAGVSDNTDITWNCMACNDTLCGDLNRTVTNITWGVNRTVYVRRPPTVSYGNNQVANAAYDADGIVKFNFTSTGISSKYACELWENSSGTWGVSQNYLVSNATYYTFNYLFLEKSSTIYDIKCYNSNNANIYASNGTNRTLVVDLTKPSVTLVSPTNGYYDADGTINFTINATDIFLDACELWTSTNGNTTDFRLNQTNTSMVSGSVWYAKATVFARNISGGYLFNAMCNDSANNKVYSSNYTFYVESNSSFRIESNTSNTVRGYCDRLQINWSTGVLETNGSITYGKTINASDGIATSSNSYDTTSHSVNIDDILAGELYYFNITSCSSSGNCNTSVKGITYKYPESLCSGWNWYAIEDSTNFSNLATSTYADYIYYWNNTAQDWIYWSEAYTTRKAFNVSRGEAVAIYTDTDEVWSRTLATAGNTTMNMNGSINFLGVQNTRLFGQLDYSLMKYENTSTAQVDSWFEILGFYNNSEQEWTTHIVNWSINNASYVHENGVIFLYKDPSYPNGTWNRNASNGHVW